VRSSVARLQQAVIKAFLSVEIESLHQGFQLSERNRVLLRLRGGQVIPPEFHDRSLWRHTKMTAKGAALLTILMISAILFMATGIVTVDAGGHYVSSDGYGVSSDYR
jgi:hypothetical protein